MKLDPVERQTILFELENKTGYSPEYLNSLSSEKLIDMYKVKCQNGKDK